MNNREWIIETLAHRPSGAVPYNLGFSPRPRMLLEEYFHTKDVPAALDMPIRMNSPASIKPLYAAPAEFGPTAADEFGVVWTTNEIDRGSPIGPSLPEADLAKFRLPDFSREYRFEHLGAWTSAQKGNFIILWVGDLWERATFIRGMENILLDVALDEFFVSGLLRRLADYILGTMGILFQWFEFDGIALSDDYGTQRGMLMSPASWRRLIKPLLAEIYGFAHKHGRIAFHHTCGNIEPIIGDLIEIGLDILHPIQPEAMDPLKIKREFGKDLTLCGGLGTQMLLPHGSPREVRAEVKRLKDQMGGSGGYILEPGITLQADVPLENLLALIEEAKAR